MKHAKDTVVIQQHLNAARGTESWIISDVDNAVEEDMVRVLRGVHINMHDYLDFRPLFIVPLETRPASGEVFRNVYLIDVKRFPEEIGVFCVNGVFLRECLPREIKVGDRERPLHMMDAIEHVLDHDFRDKLSNIHLTHGCIFIGVYGHDAIHASRGQP